MSKRKSPLYGRRWRSFFAIALAALVFITPFNFAAFAQEQASSVDAAASSKTVDSPQGDAFVVYDNGNGASCRAATMAERSSILKRTPTQGLRQINHLQPTTQKGESYATAGDNSATGLTIILQGTSRLAQHPEIEAAFKAAAAHWEAIIKTPMTVYMLVDYGDTLDGEPWPAGVIASTGSPSVFAGYPAVRNNLIAEATNSGSPKSSIFGLLPATLTTDLGESAVVDVNASIARAIGILPANATTNDPMPSLTFNSVSFNYDLDPNDGIDSNKTDFDGVATHEIGHALGFTSNNGGDGEPPNVEVWDLFRFRPGVTSFNANQRIMLAGGSQVYFDGGANELGLSTGGPDGKSVGGDGRQSSHWKDDNSIQSAYIGVMDPTIGAGRRQFITDNDKRALNMFGYNLDNSTAPPPAPPAPTPPANNNFANAQAVAGCTGSIKGTNLGANKEAGERNHAGNSGGRSVWYTWQAPSTGSVTFTTLGSSFDTILAAYSSTTLPTAATPALDQNDDVPDVNGVHRTYSSITFNAVAGTTYQIAVDGFNNNGSGGDAGNIKLSWNQPNCSVSPTPTPTPTPTPVATPTPPPIGIARVGLSSQSYSVNEGDVTGVLTFTINRTGDTAGAVSVDYTTSDNSGLTPCQTNGNAIASDRCDYATASGTVRFASGDNTPKVIQVPIINDTYVEPAEAFTITLKNIQGGALDIQAATAVIIDNDTQAATVNPIADQAFFIKEQYIDFLGRVAEPAGFQFWMDRMTNCPQGQVCDRIDTSKRFFESDEFDQRGFFVYRLYDVSLGRFPLYAEFVPDVARLNGFQTVEEQRANKDAYLADFLKKPEFTNSYGQYVFTNNTLVPGQAAGFVNALCTKAGITPANKQTLINNLANGIKTPAQTLEDFILTPEISNPGTKFYDRARIVMQYFGYLRRDPEPGGFNFWWEQLTNPANGHLQDYRFMVGGFIGSDEYKFRFGQQ